MAQAIHESGAGLGDLALRSNNHFGIKCKNTWTGDVVYHDDDSAGECFRSYPSVADSYRDHSDFLRSGKRYAFLFNIPPTDYNGWANGLKQAGYATNPQYPAIIARLIEENDLESLTETALVQSGNTIWLTAVKTTVEPSAEPSELKPAETAKPVALKSKAGEEDAPKPAVIRINHCKAIQAYAGMPVKRIAALYDVDADDLFRYNDMKPVDRLGKAQVFFLEEKRKKGEEKIHIVKKGETLWAISQAEGIRLDKLLDYNDLRKNATLKSGQKLKLR
jgi:LysM repeat protein